METKPLITYRHMQTLFLAGHAALMGGETPTLGVRIASALPNPEGEERYGFLTLFCAGG